MQETVASGVYRFEFNQRVFSTKAPSKFVMWVSLPRLCLGVNNNNMAKPRKTSRNRERGKLVELIGTSLPIETKNSII